MGMKGSEVAVPAHSSERAKGYVPVTSSATAAWLGAEHLSQRDDAALMDGQDEAQNEGKAKTKTKWRARRMSGLSHGSCA